MFHAMRATPTIIEAEMDDVLDENNPIAHRAKEWNNLCKVALSVCDDYMHTEVFESWKDCSPRQKRRTTAVSGSVLTTQYNEKNPNQLEDDHVEEVRDDHVVLNHDANPKEEKVKLVQLGKQSKRPHTRRRRRDNVEESVHVSGDQEMLVDRNGRETEDPLGTEAHPHVWRHQASVCCWGMVKATEH